MIFKNFVNNKKNRTSKINEKTDYVRNLFIYLLCNYICNIWKCG